MPLVREKVRFWAHSNRSEVKLTIHKGEWLHWGQSWPTDEGYSYIAHSWYFDGCELHRETNSGGRDCDGPIDYYSEHTATVDQIEQNDGWPDWNRDRTVVTDLYAQRMGY